MLVTDNNDDMLAKATARIADAESNAEVRKVDVSNLASVPDGRRTSTASLLLHITQDGPKRGRV